MMTTATSQTTKSGVCVGSVPALEGVIFFRAREPAMARTGTLMRNRPMSMANPRIVL